MSPRGGAARPCPRRAGRCRVCVLPRHYGVCFDCGALSPCPDELTERRSERAVSDVDPFELIFDDIVAHAGGQFQDCP